MNNKLEVIGIDHGWSMMKSGIIPGMTAAWGSSPGGASAMVAMAGAYGADVRLVALMQYLRVMLVVLTASTVAHFLLSTKTPASGVSRGIQQLASFDGSLSQLALTLLITTVCSFLAYRLKIPAGSLLLTMVVGALLNSRGLVDFRLPGLFQAGASLFLSCVLDAFTEGGKLGHDTVTIGLKARDTL